MPHCGVYQIRAWISAATSSVVATAAALAPAAAAAAPAAPAPAAAVAAFVDTAFAALSQPMSHVVYCTCVRPNM